jgi:uncharacterized protein (UPF0332 family)
MGLLEKSDENKRVAKKCLDTKAYNAGISRAYYSVFQLAEHHLKNSISFGYDVFLKKNTAEHHIPHGKMQLALVECLLSEGKKIHQNISLFDALYRRRRQADYTNIMFEEPDLKLSLMELETLLAVIG